MGPWKVRPRSSLLTVEANRFVEVLQRRCGIRACRGAVPSDPEHARIVGIASPVGSEGDVPRAQIARLLRELAERHRSTVRGRRDDPLRSDTFRHPIMERLQRVEAVRRDSTPAVSHPRHDEQTHAVLRLAVAAVQRRQLVLEYILRARAAYAKPTSRERNTEGISLLELALALDSHSAEAQSMMAGALAGRVLNGLSNSTAADLERAKGLSEQALAASFRSPLAHIAKAHLRRAQRRYAEAIPEYETALAYNRNYVYAFFALGQCKLHTGSIEETIPLVARAIRLSPRDPELGVWYKQIGNAHLLRSHTDEAVIWLEKARNHTPAHPTISGDLASAYALNGQTERATAELAEARMVSPDDRYSSIARLKKVRNFEV